MRGPKVAMFKNRCGGAFFPILRRLARPLTIRQWKAGLFGKAGSLHEKICCAITTGFADTMCAKDHGKNKMTDDDLYKIELRLGIELPGDYRTVFKDHASAVRQQTFGFKLMDNANWIINETSRFRLEGDLAGKHPNEFIVIGESGCGDYYFLDLGQTPSPVMMSNHETGELDYIASSVLAWLKRIVPEIKSLKR